MKPEEILEKLKLEQEMNPDAHDGSYELMREIVSSYSKINDLSVINFLDLNAVYGMALGTWKLNAEKKKDYVKKGHLPFEEKERLTRIIDQVWDNACRGKYSNREGKGPSIGMFGTGFYSFEGKIDDKSCQRFIKLLIDISGLGDDNQMFGLCDKVFDSEFKGMQAAAASVMLHCLKPYTFPILNANFGDGTVYGPLGISLVNPGKLSTYIENCRKIKSFRDANLTIKNYRILDIFPRKYKLFDSDIYFPSLEEYDPGITTEQFVELLQDTNIVYKQTLDTIFYLFDIGGEATCSALASKYGNSAFHYNSNATHLAKAIQNATNCPMSSRSDNSGDRYWAILFQGRYTDKSEQGTFSWKLRQPLYEAISELNEQGFFDEFIPKETEKMNNTMDKNLILYGPPGTGKTYNTVIYSVAIIEDKPVEEVKKEALPKSGYESVKKRYDEYKKDGRVAFVTFHQSYGYEEFIEGIKPVVNDNDSESGGLEYTIEPGIFKKFCERAGTPKKKRNTDYGLNSSPSVWKVSLEKTGENPTRRECFENNHIRIGWDEYGPVISDDVNYPSGKVVLNQFINKMKIGDIVLSCFSSTQIDAIGIVTGDYEWVNNYDYYRRVRKVKWLAKDIREDIIEINGGHTLTLSTVYKLNVSLSDIMELINKYTKKDGTTFERNDDKYVFVIDEINRGNISKIFGELITLIEDTKRLGAKEETTARLPYSNESFGVPDNVYIIGTMNTADRSIALMDTALRRRFNFIEMMPDTNIISGITVTADGETLDIAKMLDVINKRIEYLYDREHTIGHAFFTDLNDDNSLKHLANIFRNKVIPLLQEYFYEDYEKIQLVLGDDEKSKDSYKFVLDKPTEIRSLFKKNPQLDLHEKTFEIQKDAFEHIQSYIEITERR